MKSRTTAIVPAGELSVFSPGDHLVTPSRLPTGQIVTHHGVAVPINGRLAVVSKSGRPPAGVRATTVAEFGHGDAFTVTKLEDRSLPRNEALSRAMSSLGDRRYHLLDDNCEHFATWACRDERSCSQVGGWLTWAPYLGRPLGQLAVIAVRIGGQVLGCLSRGAPPDFPISRAVREEE